MSRDYTFRHECDVCGARPVLKVSGMCGPCTYGEADSAWDWINDYWTGSELKLAKQYIHDLYKELKADGMGVAPEIHARLQSILRAPKEKKK